MRCMDMKMMFHCAQKGGKKEKKRKEKKTKKDLRMFEVKVYVEQSRLVTPNAFPSITTTYCVFFSIGALLLLIRRKDHISHAPRTVPPTSTRNKLT